MRLKPTRQHYEQVVELRRKGMSIREIASKTGVAKSAVHRWLSIFAGENVTSMESKNDTPKRAKGIKAPESLDRGLDKDANGSQEALQEKIARLERELAEVKLQRDLYDEIINVAEQKFDIQIRKKAGTKR